MPSDTRYNTPRYAVFLYFKIRAEEQEEQEDDIHWHSVVQLGTIGRQVSRSFSTTKADTGVGLS